MDKHLANTEKNIQAIVDSGFGERHNLVLRVEDIEEIPVDNFEYLQDMFLQGNAIIRQMPARTSNTIFQLLASRSERWSFNIVSMLTYIIPLAGIVLAFVYSWWYLLLFIAPVITIPKSKKIYLRTVFRRCMLSEVIFCFAFCGQYITLELPLFGILYRGMEAET